MPKPVIFVPGYPGSELREAASGRKAFLKLSTFVPAPDEGDLLRLHGPDDLLAADPIEAGPPIERFARFLLFDLGKQAKSLYDILEGLGIDPVKLGWDWRRPVWDLRVQSDLEVAIRRLHQQSGQRVTVIAHSTGGLVVRYLLEMKPELVDRIERLVCFGVPWAGVLKSLRFLAGVDPFVTVPAARAQALIATTWAAFDLLPPDPTRTDMTDAAGNPLDLVIDGSGRQVSPLIKRGWFPAHLAAAMRPRAVAADRELGVRTPALQLGTRRLEVTNVVGWGSSTAVQATISGSGAGQTISGWRIGADVLDGGDGTVPYRSASWLRGADVTTYHLPVGFHSGATQRKHSSLWRNPGGRNLLHHLLVGEALTPFVYTAVDEDDFGDLGADRVRVRISALRDDGAPIPQLSLRSTDLVGQQLELELQSTDGRHIVRVPRAAMRIVHQQMFRRFTLRLSWDGGSVDRVLIVRNA